MTLERDALLRAIIANPDEDTPRLVYADWLEEHGEAKRAAFIRAKIDFHNRENADTEAAYVYQFLQSSYAGGNAAIDWSKIDLELAAIHTADAAAYRNACNLKPKAEGVPRMKGIQFEGDVRGFLCAITANDGESFLEHGEEIFRHAPITDVTFNYLDASDAREIVKRGFLARIRDLAIWDMEESQPLAVFGSHPDAAGVRSLELLATDQDDAELVNALARGKHWTGLRTLKLGELGEDDEEISDAHQTRLFRKPVFAGLRKLVADECRLGDAAARAIAAGGMPELRYLDLSFNRIGEEGFRAISRSKGLSNLRYLDLSVNRIYDDAAYAEVINSANLAKLTVLRLVGDETAALDSTPLTKPGRGQGLRVLDLEGVHLGHFAVLELTACPAVRGLWYLDLNNTNQSSAGQETLLLGSQFESLAFLSLTHNKLNVRAARAIAKMAPPSLQWLELESNPLTPNGLAALADSPNLGGLNYLSVSGPATSKGFKKLKKRFGKALHRVT
jgi:uncharacterized protein (TIGR02996 family)